MTKEKNSKKQLRNKADKLWFKRYLENYCEVCGKKGEQVHHFYYRKTYPFLRYHEKNAITLCRGCHASLHWRDPKGIEEKIIEKRGQKWYKDLKEKAQNPPNKNITIGYLREVINKLKEDGKNNS